MLRPRSVLRLAELIDDEFTWPFRTGSFTRPDLFAEFLFEHEFPRSVREYLRSAPAQPGGIKRTVLMAWEHWTISPGFSGTEQTEHDRERWFVRLAELILDRSHLPAKRRQHLGLWGSTRRAPDVENSLRLDGYAWDGGRLRRIDENVFDVVEQAGALEALWRRLGLGQPDQFRHNLQRTDEHYEEGRWDDCILHVRHVVEVSFRQIAAARETLGFEAVPKRAERQPVVVREHLRLTGFYDQQEQTLLDAIYAIVSRDGGHPNIPPQENARILRQHAFTMVHFLLLRFDRLHSRSDAVPAKETP